MGPSYFILMKPIRKTGLHALGWGGVSQGVRKSKKKKWQKRLVRNGGSGEQPKHKKGQVCLGEAEKKTATSAVNSKTIALAVSESCSSNLHDCRPQ